MIRYEIDSSFDNFKDFLLDIKVNFNKNKNTIHKARNELKIINSNNIDVVVKSFKIPNIINQVVYAFFRKSKAKKSYKYSLKIDKFTPDAIGYIEFYRFGLLKNSFFISKKFDYDFTIREPLLDKNFENRDLIFKAFANFTLKLHNNNIYHKDYSPGNILIKKDNSNYIFKIVDINRMRFFKLTQKQRAKNFSKLWASDDILEIIANEYMKNYNCDDNFINLILYFSNKNKKIKNFKKKLKGQEVND